MAAYIGTRVPQEASLRTESILVAGATVEVEVEVEVTVVDESVERPAVARRYFLAALSRYNMPNSARIPPIDPAPNTKPTMKRPK